jgi:hypothetical protein
MNHASSVLSVLMFGALLGGPAWLTQSSARHLEESPPATEALDLHRIAGIQYLDERDVQFTDESGRHMRVALREDCPGLEQSQDISLVTQSVKALHRFSGIAVGGHVCRFEKPGGLA